MNGSPEPKRVQPKLMTRGKLFGMFIALLVAVSWRIAGDYGAHGKVSTLTIVTAIFAFVVSFSIVAAVGWYANKPEK
jgi:hypothetical protein